MEEVFVRYVHFLGIIMLAAALVGEHLLIVEEMTIKSFKKLVVVDAIYGIAAMATLTAGILLLFVVGKPAEFYTSNVVFHIKLTVFICIGVLSAFPTIYFLRNRKALTDTVVLPSYIIRIVRIELMLLVILPLLAAMMARGIGNT